MSRKPRARVYQHRVPRRASRSSSRCATARCRCCSGSGRASRSPAPGRCRAACSQPGETLEESIRRHLAAKVDVREVAHLEQLDDAQRAGPHPERVGARDGVSRPRPARRRSGAAGRHALAPGRRAAADRVRPRRDRARRPRAAARRSSRTRTSASRSRRRRSRSRSCATLYAAALGHDVSATNLSACSSAAACSSRRASAASPGRAGGRPAARLPLPRARARDHRPVRSAAAAGRAGGDTADRRKG